ncbi:MAG: NAD(P)-dependent oxidoreductase, partial [Candidatus Aenigmarchaeota archaeon]|nr:NAD(P)-dependent oxidoreductase [Candidatus Aenigmarchaeota archaeon]
TKLIALMSTDYAWVDIKKARDLGITVTNVPGYATESVAEHTFGLIISVLKNITKADKSVRNGEWVKEPFKGSELKGKILGIIGLGRIGSRVAEIPHGFGMEVIANDIKPRSISGVKMVESDELLKRSDIVTLHCNLNPTSEGLIDEDKLNQMKPSAILINTSNGKVVDTEALVKALKEKRIAGAGIDVLPKRPGKNDPLLQLDNVVITPEIAFNTSEALMRRVDICIDNIEAFIKGKPQNVVN